MNFDNMSDCNYNSLRTPPSITYGVLQQTIGLFGKKEKKMKIIEWNLHPDVEAYTTTRQLGDISFNNPDHLLVLRHRQELASLLNSDLEHMVAPRQTHSTNLKQVYLKDGGTNMLNQSDVLKEVDATYTKDKDLFLLSFHADCTPVLVYCKDQKIVCAIHSGWLGTVRQIVDKTIRYLIEHEQCHPENMYCLIGPCISKKHLEVQDDVIEQVKKMNFDTSPFYIKTDDIHYLLDNRGLNKQQLLNLKVPEENIQVSDYCTVENNDLFFSHRKNKDGARNITLIKLK